MKDSLENICALEGGKYWDEGTLLYHYDMTISKIYKNGSVGLVFHNFTSDSDWNAKNIIEEKLSPIYSDITLLHSSNTEAYLITRKDNKCGLIFCSYNYIKECLKTEYDNIELFNNLSYSFLIKSNGLYGIYDARFINNIIPCSYEKIERIIEYRENIFYIVSQKGLKGVCNKHGKLSIPCLFENIELSYGHFYLTKDNLTGVSDETYRIIVPINYEKVFYLGNGIFRIHDNGCMGLYANNTEICQPIYDDISAEYIIKKGECVGILIDSGSITKPIYDIIEPIYEDIFKLDKNLYAYKQSGKWGIIKNNQVITKPEFDGFKCGKYGIGVLKDKHYGLINSNGKIIVPIQYDKIIYQELRVFGRIGRELYVLEKFIKDERIFPKTFLIDYSCEYESSNSSLFMKDCNLVDLLAPLTE